MLHGSTRPALGLIANPRADPLPGPELSPGPPPLEGYSSDRRHLTNMGAWEASKQSARGLEGSSAQAINPEQTGAFLPAGTSTSLSVPLAAASINLKTCRSFLTLHQMKELNRTNAAGVKDP